jgi:hypothetical protein
MFESAAAESAGLHAFTALAYQQHLSAAVAYQRAYS